MGQGLSIRFGLALLCAASYVNQFRRLPKHRQAASYSDRSVLDDSSVTTVEECARQCLLAADRPCQGFNYRRAATSYGPCRLLYATSLSVAVYADDTDYYQRLHG